MNRTILISLAIFMGCFFSSKVKDYTGEKINLGKHPFAIISYQEDTFNEEIYYITYETVEIKSSYQDAIDTKEEKIIEMRNKIEEEPKEDSKKMEKMKEKLEKNETKLDVQKAYLKNKKLKRTTAIRNEIMGFCMEFGYSSYHVVEDSGWNTFTIHCHKTEEEYIKYDEIYRKE